MITCIRFHDTFGNEDYKIPHNYTSSDNYDIGWLVNYV